MNNGRIRREAGRLGRAAPLCRGFSLMELLLVIAIITMLVTIAVPSLSRAKDLARRATCLSNVRRLALSVQTYTATYDSVLPPHRLPYTRSGKTYVNDYGREQPRWQWFLQEGAGPAIERAGYASEAEFQTSTTMSNDYFICPSVEDNPATLDKDESRDIRDGAYGYNHQYLGSGRVKVYTSGSKYIPMNWPVRIDRVHNSSGTVLLGDSRGAITSKNMIVRHHSYTLDSPRVAASLGFADFGPMEDPGAGVPAEWQHSPAHERHLDTASIAFVDAHAEPMSLQALGYVLDSDGIATKDAGSNELWTGTDQNEP